MVTAEAAVVLPVLVFALAGALAAVAIVTAQLRCIDAAREGARAAARGETDAATRLIAQSAAPAGSSISIRRAEESAVVRVSTSVPLIPGLGPPVNVSAEAVAALEPGLDVLAASRSVPTTTDVRSARGPPP